MNDILVALDALPDLTPPRPSHLECAENVWERLKGSANPDSLSSIFETFLGDQRTYLGIPVHVMRFAPQGWYVLYDQYNGVLRKSANFDDYSPHKAASAAELDEQ